MLADLIMEKASWMRVVSPPETFKILFLADLNIFASTQASTQASKQTSTHLTS